MITRPRTRPVLLNNPPNPSPSQPATATSGQGVQWGTVFISAAVGGAAIYLVGKLLSSAEKKFFPDQPQQPPQPQLPPSQPQQQLPPPPPGYVYTPVSPAPPMPSMMQPYGYQAPQPQQVVLTPAVSQSGLTESDLHAWAHELETRETDLERREQSLKAEQRRLRLVS
jgi:hypothetical protein